MTTSNNLVRDGGLQRPQEVAGVLCMGSRNRIEPLFASQHLEPGADIGRGVLLQVAVDAKRGADEGSPQLRQNLPDRLFSEPDG